MSRHFRQLARHFQFILPLCLMLLVNGLGLRAQDGATAMDTTSEMVVTSTIQQAALNTKTAAVAAESTQYKAVFADFFADMSDSLLNFFDIHHRHNNWMRYVLAAVILVVFYAVRRLVLPLIFKLVRKIAGRASLTLVERLLHAIEKPVALFIMISGIFVVLSTLRYSRQINEYLKGGVKWLFAIVFLWLAVRIVDALLGYAHEKATRRNSQIVVFIPWIRKAVVAILIVIGVLLILQNHGFDVQAILATLGIGGLAVALAAQDTVANVFGAAVVALDQPFHHGDTVQLAGHIGTVEDIGVRSMKLRRTDKALVVIPNKTVASESIVNLSKFTNRRVEQVLGFTYDSTPEQLAAIVEEIKTLINAEPEVLRESTMVYFRDFSASSLDLWVVYVTKEPDFAKYMSLRQRLNLAFMRAASTRGLGFAFPTQTIDLAPSAAKVFEKK